MIDPSSSEEESDEDQSTHHGGGGGAKAAGHGARRHPGGGGGGPSAGAAGGTTGMGLTASPGGPSSQGGAMGSPNLHGPGAGGGGSGHSPHGRNIAAGQSQPPDNGSPGLDVPNSSSARTSLSPSMGATQDAANYGKSAQRPTSPSPSVASEKTEADLQVIHFDAFSLNLLPFSQFFNKSIRPSPKKFTRTKN